jgi:RimJ/RimL family protein N-acetyltransferase
VTLRELRLSDAGSLHRHLSTARVRQHLAEGPTSLPGFKRFITWTLAERRRGFRLCYGVVPATEQQAVGFLQLWCVDESFAVSEWGFVLGEQYWGRGIFHQSALAFLDLAFGTLGVVRLEARTRIDNDRAKTALRRLGATEEGTLRGEGHSRPRVVEQVMWAILAADWARRSERSEWRG